MQPVSYSGTSGLIAPNKEQEKEYKFLRINGVPESFLATYYPESRLDYWKQICQADCKLTVQLDLEGLDYHLKKNDSFIYAPLRITLDSEEPLAEGVFYREYTLYNTLTGERRTHHHLNIFWPDSGTPSADNFIALYHRYNELISRMAYPNKVMVHCRAGKGRTGCFIFTRCLALSQNEKPNDVYFEIHKQHAILLTHEQYAFAEEASKLQDENNSTEEAPRHLHSFQQKYLQARVNPYQGSEEDRFITEPSKAISERIYIIFTQALAWSLNLKKLILKK